MPVRVAVAKSASSTSTGGLRILLGLARAQLTWEARRRQALDTSGRRQRVARRVSIKDKHTSTLQRRRVHHPVVLHVAGLHERS